MSDELKTHMEEAIWCAKSLFERGKTSGSSANLSFLCDGRLYITCSGSCFGRLTPEDFSELAVDGTVLNGRRPSKEWPLHRLYYGRDSGVQAVIHTHGTYAVLWSCLPEEESACLPRYTPYLAMKVGRVGMIPYAEPGSPELFEAFRRGLPAGDAYLLRNHGAVVGGKSLLAAFYGLEELEESCRIAWELRNTLARPLE